MDNTLTTEIFAPYVDALNNYNVCCDKFRAAERAANDVLHKIEKRQAAERSQIAAKLTDLENKEKRLKAIVRQHVLNGENPLSADLETGAKLAIISEQKNALQVLAGKRCMTDEEKTSLFINSSSSAKNLLPSGVNLSNPAIFCPPTYHSLPCAFAVLSA